jgi:hypothetical protein
VGYVTDLTGLGLTAALTKDLTVNLPFKPTYPQLGAKQGVNGGPSTANVVGVIENLTWTGGVGDPIALQFYVSQENATRLKALAQSGLKTTSIQSIGWWIGDYDQEAKTWFEQSKPASSPTIQAMIQSNSLNVDMTPVPVKAGIDVTVCKVSIKIMPPANQVSTLSFANSSTKPVMKAWGATVTPQK